MHAIMVKDTHGKKNIPEVYDCQLGVHYRVPLKNVSILKKKIYFPYQNLSYSLLC